MNGTAKISITLLASKCRLILRKEDKTMNYTKPEVTVLGNATGLIELINKDGLPGDPPSSFNAPAYDLDE